MSVPYLSYRERVAAVRDCVDFFTRIEPGHLDVDVQTCPDWTVEGVLRHVSGGASAACEMVERADDSDLDIRGVLTEHMSRAESTPFAELAPPLTHYVALLDSLDENLNTFLHLRRAPLHEQVWHVSGDWGMHRHDVELALGRTPTLTPDRAADLLGWLTEYLHRVLETMWGWERAPGIRLVANDTPLDTVAGEGEPRAVLRGAARDLLMLLWRRPTGPVPIEGDPTALYVFLDRLA